MEKSLFAPFKLFGGLIKTIYKMENEKLLISMFGWFLHAKSRLNCLFNDLKRPLFDLAFILRDSYFHLARLNARVPPPKSKKNVKSHN